jgi:hypothetical protein
MPIWMTRTTGMKHAGLPDCLFASGFDRYQLHVQIQPQSGGRYGSPGWSEAEPRVRECRKTTVRDIISKNEVKILSDGRNE